ncbi:NAAT family transporter, partial [Priestia megaterium]
MLALILKLTISFFAVMNPIGNIPIFITLTNDYSIQERRHSARKAVFISFIILTLFLLLGSFIFSAFGITIHAFRVAGGILIFGIAYSLL